MRSARRNFALGLSVVAATTALSLSSAEIGLRLFTRFPISYLSNLVHDSNLGYRLSASLNDIAKNGFRNPSANSPIDIFAVGDSHTFGNNVGSKDSWPSVLASETALRVYNTGIGSYGIASYHAILTQFLGETRESKALVAIYVRNDFLPKFSFCEIEFDKEFWLREQRRLGMNLLPSQRGCDMSNIRTKPEWGKWIIGNVAVVSIVNRMILKPFENYLRSIPLPSGLPNIDESSLTFDDEMAHGETDLMQQSIRIFADWGATWKGRVAIVLIPSKARVFYEILRNRQAISGAPAALVAVAKRQIELEDFVLAQAALNGIPIESALPDLVKEMDKDLYPVFDNHPYEKGYIAYARAAKRALKTLSK